MARTDTVILLLALLLCSTVSPMASARDVPGQESEPNTLLEQARSSDRRASETDRSGNAPIVGEDNERSATAEPRDTLPSAETATSFDPSRAKKSQGHDFRDSIWSMIKLSTQWLLHWRQLQEAVGEGESPPRSANRFDISRGYLTLAMSPVKWFESRITIDTSQDDKGNWGVRLKYLYGKFKLPVENAIVTEPYAEYGLAHNPWFDYEEHINFYRMQGTMFIERNKIQNSADLGLTVGGLLGKKLDEEYQKKISKYYPGTWGSFALGLYNGGGYHASEQNQNKVFEGRVSIRPLGSFHPNWQVSYYGLWGKGNIAAEPDWQTNIIFTSYEHQYFVLTGQYTFGKGNQKGDKFFDAGGDGEFDVREDHSLDFQGASGFAEIRLSMIRSSLIGRYDFWKWEGSEPSHRVIGGYAFHIQGERETTFLVDYDRVIQKGQTAAWELKATLQVVF